MTTLRHAVQQHLERDSAMRPACVTGLLGDGITNHAIDAAETRMLHVISMPDPLACLSRLQLQVVLLKYAGQEYVETVEAVRGVYRGTVSVAMRRRVDTRDCAIARELGISCEDVRRLLREAEELVAGADERAERAEREHRSKCE